MATVLIAWELGAGMGHMARLLPVARGLAERGHRPILVSKNVVETAPLLAEDNFPVLQAPFWHPRQWAGSGPFLAASFADVLAIRGFAEAATLQPMVRAWQALIDLTAADLIVCDNSPTLQLAAYGDISVVEVGTGFTMPPVDGDWFPRIVPEGKPAVPQQQLLEVVRTVQQNRGRKRPETLTGFLRNGNRMIGTWPELDPYRSLRNEPALGPMTRAVSPSSRPEKPCFFAYVGADYPSLHQILGQLARSGLPGEAYLRSAVPALKEHVRASGLIVHDTPPPLEAVLRRVSFIMHHGGVNTTESALLSGCPQLILPRHVEQKLNADAVEVIGVGKGLSGNLCMNDIIQTSHRLCGADYADRAAKFAATLSAREDTKPLQQVLERCERLL